MIRRYHHSEAEKIFPRV